MKKLLLIGLILCRSAQLFAQQPAIDSVKQAVNTMFDAMRKGDSTTLRSVFAADMRLQSISTGKDGKAVISTDAADVFLKAIGTPHTQVYDERIVFDAVKVDEALASVWAPYQFYLGDKFHHCGVDVFQLMRTAGGWKIIYIVDTRRTANCAN
jgi:hypothetical protein